MVNPRPIIEKACFGPNKLLIQTESAVFRWELLYKLFEPRKVCIQKRCEHRKNVVNTVDVFFSVQAVKCRWDSVKNRGRRQQALPSLEYTHQPWSSPIEEGLRFSSSGTRTRVSVKESVKEGEKGVIRSAPCPTLVPLRS